MPFLPVTKEEMLKRGWDRPDFVYVCGDAVFWKATVIRCV